MKLEEQRSLAIDCGAGMWKHVYDFTFTANELAAYTAAVEAKVLEEAENRCISLPASANTVMDCSELLCRMIESRKQTLDSVV